MRRDQLAVVAGLVGVNHDERLPVHEVEDGKDEDDMRRAGYSDPAAFRRVFKQATGLSPSRYREVYGLRNSQGN